jgi:DNA modification methylase
LDTGKDGNRRSVWTVPTKPFKGAHFATFPPDLIEPCILAGCSEGGIVLDPFAGSGTTLAVAVKHYRKAIGIELNAEYLPLIVKRIGAELDQGRLDFGKPTETPPETPPEQLSLAP